MTWFVRATGHEPSSEIAICRHFSKEEWATNGPQRPRKGVSRDNTTGRFARKNLSGSDGTRTRDLRRDRPNRAWRRTSTNRSERPHVQGLSLHGRPCSAWLSRSSNRRLGHKWATRCVATQFADSDARAYLTPRRLARSVPLGDRRRADDVGDEDGDDPPLAGGNGHGRSSGRTTMHGTGAMTPSC
jgi:hypothetical protein